MGNAANGGRGAKLHGSRNVRVILCGLRDSGRESFLSKLGKYTTESLSDGSEYQQVSHRGLKIVSWPVGERRERHEVWRPLYEDSEALIFVVDSTNAEHLVNAKKEFWFLLTEEELRHCHVLVLASNCDQLEAMTIADIIEGLELDSIHGRDWFIQGMSATKGDGIEEGLAWLQQQLTSKA